MVNRRLPLLVIAPLCITLLGLTGCAGIAQHEYADFSPLPEQHRQMNQFKLTWDVRMDAEEFCKQRKMDKGVSIQGTVLACAVRSVRKQACKIVTGPAVSHVVLGHELRHCFEGHFHP